MTLVCKKISCEDEAFNNIVIELKTDNLSRSNMPKMIVGTGLSASFQVPGMKQLAAELKNKLDRHDDSRVRTLWREKVPAIDKFGLEDGLKSLNSSEEILINEIKKITTAFILQEEQKLLCDIYNKKSGFEHLLMYLKETCSINYGILDIMTPNYDRIIEILCDKCNISVITGFEGQIFRRFNATNLKKPDIQYNLKNNFFVRLFKPHGSINWIERNGDEYLINDYELLSKYSDNIEIIAPGNSKYKEGMLNNTFRTMREDFYELISDNAKPYSLFIYGYGFNDSHFNTVLFQNKYKKVLILSKEIRDDVIDRATKNKNVTAFYQHDDKEYMIYKGENIEIDKSLWNIDVFADVFLG